MGGPEIGAFIVAGIMRDRVEAVQNDSRRKPAGPSRRGLSPDDPHGPSLLDEPSGPREWSGDLGPVPVFSVVAGQRAVRFVGSVRRLNLANAVARCVVSY